MCRGCNYLLSPSTDFAVRCHCIGGAWNHHFARVFYKAVKQMKDKRIRQVCMKEQGGGGLSYKEGGMSRNFTPNVAMEICYFEIINY